MSLLKSYVSMVKREKIPTRSPIVLASDDRPTYISNNGAGSVRITTGEGENYELYGITGYCATQLATLTPANVEIGDIFTVIINSLSISFTATVATVANVTAGLTTAINASGVASLVTATDNTTTITIVGDSGGRFFTVSTSTTNGGATDNQTLTATNVQTNGLNYKLQVYDETDDTRWFSRPVWIGMILPINALSVMIAVDKIFKFP